MLVPPPSIVGSSSVQETLNNLMQERDLLHDQIVEKERALSFLEEENLNVKKKLENLQSLYFRDVVQFFNQKFLGDETPINTQAKWLEHVNNRVTIYNDLLQKLSKYQKVFQSKDSSLNEIINHLKQENLDLKKELLKQNFFLNKGFNPQRIQSLQKKLWSKEMIFKKIEQVNHELENKLVDLKSTVEALNRERKIMQRSFLLKLKQINNEATSLLEKAAEKNSVQQKSLQSQGQTNSKLELENAFLKNNNESLLNQIEYLESILQRHKILEKTLEAKSFEQPKELAAKITQAYNEVSAKEDVINLMQNQFIELKSQYDEITNKLNQQKEEFFVSKNAADLQILELEKKEQLFTKLNKHISHEVNLLREYSESLENKILHRKQTTQALKLELKLKNEQLQTVIIANKILRNKLEKRLLNKTNLHHSLHNKLSEENLFLARDLQLLQKELQKQQSQALLDSKMKHQQIKAAEDAFRKKQTEHQYLLEELKIAEQETFILKESLNKLHQEHFSEQKNSSALLKESSSLKDQLDSLTSQMQQVEAKILKKKEKIKRLKQLIEQQNTVSSNQEHSSPEWEELIAQRNALLKEVELAQQTLSFMQKHSDSLEKLSSLDKELILNLKENIQNNENVESQKRQTLPSHLKSFELKDIIALLNKIDLPSLEKRDFVLPDKLKQLVESKIMIQVISKILPAKDSVTNLLRSEYFKNNASPSEIAELKARKMIETTNLIAAYKLLKIHKLFGKPLKEIKRINKDFLEVTKNYSDDEEISKIFGLAI